MAARGGQAHGAEAGEPRGRPFRATLSISFTAVSLACMLLVAAASLATYNRTMRETAAQDQRQIVELVNLNIDNYLRSMMKISDAAYYGVIKDQNLAQGGVGDGLSLFYDENQDRLVSIALFTIEGRLVTATPLSSVKPVVDVTEQDWFRSAVGQLENLHFSTPHVQNIFENADFRYNWVVSLSRAVELTYGGATAAGVLLVDMNVSGIDQICRRVSLGASGYVYITDPAGELVYHPKQQLIYAGVERENNLAESALSDGTHATRFGGRERSVAVKTVGYTGWKIVCVAYASEIAPFRGAFLFLAMIFLFAIVLLAFANYLVSSRVADPITSLERQLAGIESGRLDPGLAVAASGSYEVRRLARSINEMLARIRLLMSAIVDEHEQKRKSELDALQAQINPHFLYNAMDSIVWMIERGEHRKASGMVTSLSRLFRISISKGRSVIAVRDELEHARCYLAIQGTRYGGRFQYEVSASQEALGMATLKLVVQPVVENAILHGVAGMDGDGAISVRARVAGATLLIEVEDNGLGMTGAQVARLFEGAGPLEGPAPAEGGPQESPAPGGSGGSGIGLRNVQERIRLYCGAGYGLSVRSAPDEGTRVTIRLPARPFGAGGGP
jgi:two-component system sensor histidine kinase YesM